MQVILDPIGQITETDSKGDFIFESVAAGKYVLRISTTGMKSPVIRKIEMPASGKLTIEVEIDSLGYSLGPISITDQQNETANRLNSVVGMAIYAGKKTELILVESLNANLSTNNARQVFNRVPGLNIWENDGGGLQLGIGGRGLSPNRSSNFNTRQNGYDIAADALGYPESYYTPPTEAIERIEIVRGAASLQYGTQFGGMVNFKFREGPSDKKIELTTRQTIGSYGYFSSFNSIGGTIGKFNYRAFYQGKRGNGWRDNSGFQQHTAFGDLQFQLSPRLKLQAEYTFMRYLAQQPGGLTDALFANKPRQSIRNRNWFQVNWNLLALIADIDINAKTKLNFRNFGLLAQRDALGYLGAINRIDPGGNRDIISGKFQNFGNETRLMHKFDLHERPSVFLTGIRYYQGHTTALQGLGDAAEGANFELLNPNDPEESSYIFPSRNVAVFAEQIFPLSNKLSLTPGMRYEYIHTASEGSYHVRNYDLAGTLLSEATFQDARTRDRSIFLAGLGAAFKLKGNLESYANISRNYRAITFSDMQVVNPSFEIDPNLKDEKGFNADLGLRGQLNNWLSIDASLFYLYYQDRIGQVLMTDTTTFRYYRLRTNVSNAQSLGLEWFAEAEVLKMLKRPQKEFQISIFSNLAIIEANYIQSINTAFEGKRVELVPRLNTKLGLNLKWKKFKTGLQWAYTSGQFSDATNAINSPNAVEGWIPAYQVFDLSTSYNWRFMAFELSCNNLQNKAYFTRRAAGYPGPGIIPAEGRSIFFTLQFKI